ncbi:MAG: hypothetical protein CMO74_13050 [Verrucomicrobiales bacterium]|nr:hypothetical protein [Verrucomicrobiales bacterium]|tara:strand:+ start:193 stop:672 length:480 start_codon:yes stop_codon:yes gene_type:complete
MANIKIKKASRAVARELEVWLLELAELIGAGAGAAEPAKKKRGRPAKKKAGGKKRGRQAKKKAAGKKRGRPAKKKTAVKKRGRPAKKKTAGSAAAPKKRGRKPGGNLDKIKKAIGKRGATTSEIAKKTGIAAPNVSNYVSKNPGMFVKPAKRGGKVTLK